MGNRENRKERMTMYQWVGERGWTEQSIHPMAGGIEVTAMLPVGYRPGVREDGRRCIVCPDGTVVDDVNIGRRSEYGRTAIIYTEGKTGIERKEIVEILDNRVHMLIMAYREGRPDRRPRWSIHAFEGAEAIPLYLPRYCRLVEDKRMRKMVIELPESAPWTTRTFPGEGKAVGVPPAPMYAADFCGIGRDGMPLVLVGGRRRMHGILPEEGDRYTPRERDRRVFRLEEQLWRVDEYITDPATRTSVVRRSYHRRDPGGKK